MDNGNDGGDGRLERINDSCACGFLRWCARCPACHGAAENSACAQVDERKMVVNKKLHFGFMAAAHCDRTIGHCLRFSLLPHDITSFESDSSYFINWNLMFKIKIIMNHARRDTGDKLIENNYYKMASFYSIRYNGRITPNFVSNISITGPYVLGTLNKANKYSQNVNWTLSLSP